MPSFRISGLKLIQTLCSSYIIMDMNHCSILKETLNALKKIAYFYYPIRMVDALAALIFCLLSNVILSMYRPPRQKPVPIHVFDPNQCGHCINKDESMICKKCHKWTCSNCINEDLNTCKICVVSNSTNLKLLRKY